MKGIEDCRYDIRLTRPHVEPDRELELRQLTVPNVRVDHGEHSTETSAGDVVVNTDTHHECPDLWPFAGAGLMYHAAHECMSFQVVGGCGDPV